MSRKNLSLSPAVQDIGLGDMVKQQLDDEDEERKKKLLAMNSRNSLFGPATQSLMGGLLNG